LEGVQEKQQAGQAGRQTAQAKAALHSIRDFPFLEKNPAQAPDQQRVNQVDADVDEAVSPGPHAVKPVVEVERPVGQWTHYKIGGEIGIQEVSGCKRGDAIEVLKQVCEVFGVFENGVCHQVHLIVKNWCVGQGGAEDPRCQQTQEQEQ
jgi:hypothetical protein